MWNKIKNSKGFYIALSIFLAIVCWFYVDLTVEPDTQITVRNIPVVFEGEKALENRGLMIQNNESITVALKLSGQRSALSQLDRNSIIVTVDAANQVTKPGEHNLQYNITFPNTVAAGTVKIKSRSVETIDVSVIRSSSKNISVSGVFTGSVKEGYMEDGFRLEHNSINITGEENAIKRVDHAVVTLEKSGLSENWDGTLPIALVDHNGKTIDSSEMSLSSQEMDVTLVVKQCKELPLTVTIKEGGGATKKDIEYKISPKSITVSGSASALASVTKWNLGTVDLSQVITSSKQTMDITLPKELTCESGEQTATVSVTLPKLTTIKMDTTNIELSNQPADKLVSLVTQSLEVRCRGTKKALNLLAGNDIKVTADLSSLTADSFGICQVPAVVSIPGFSEIGAVGTYEVSVYVS